MRPASSSGSRVALAELMRGGRSGVASTAGRPAGSPSRPRSRAGRTCPTPGLAKSTVCGPRPPPRTQSAPPARRHGPAVNRSRSWVGLAVSPWATRTAPPASGRPATPPGRRGGPPARPTRRPGAHRPPRAAAAEAHPYQAGPRTDVPSAGRPGCEPPTRCRPVQLQPAVGPPRRAPRGPAAAAADPLPSTPAPRPAGTRLQRTTGLPPTPHLPPPAGAPTWLLSEPSGHERRPTTASGGRHPCSTGQLRLAQAGGPSSVGRQPSVSAMVCDQIRHASRVASPLGSAVGAGRAWRCYANPTGSADSFHENCRCSPSSQYCRTA